MGAIRLLKAASADIRNAQRAVEAAAAEGDRRRVERQAAQRHAAALSKARSGAAERAVAAAGRAVAAAETPIERRASQRARILSLRCPTREALAQKNEYADRAERIADAIERGECTTGRRVGNVTVTLLLWWLLLSIVTAVPRVSWARRTDIADIFALNVLRGFALAVVFVLVLLGVTGWLAVVLHDRRAWPAGRTPKHLRP